MTTPERDGDDPGPGPGASSPPGEGNGQPDEAGRADPSTPPSDDEAEAAWLDIVAHYGDRAVLEDATSPQESEPRGPGRAIPPDGPVVSPGLFRLAGSRVDPQEHSRPARTSDAETTDHFVPPDPPHVPLPAPLRLAAWLGLLLAPSLLLVSVLAALDLPSLVDGMLLLWFFLGFGYLVATMPRGGGDGWDDGARV